MAGITVETFMSAIKFESGALVVVKVPDLPVSGVVTVLTFCAQPSSMHVLILVTAVTGIGCLVFVQWPCVATFAGCDPVFAK